MDIHARKLHFVQAFLRVADEEIITKLEKLLLLERKKLADRELFPMSLNEFNEIVDNSENDFANNRVNEARNLFNQIDSWT